MQVEIDAAKGTRSIALAENNRDVFIEGDAVALLADASGSSAVVAFARVYRVRRALEGATIFFDARMEVTPPRDAASTCMIQPPTRGARHHWQFPRNTASVPAPFMIPS